VEYLGNGKYVGILFSNSLDWQFSITDEYDNFDDAFEATSNIPFNYADSIIAENKKGELL